MRLPSPFPQQQPRGYSSGRSLFGGRSDGRSNGLKARLFIALAIVGFAVISYYLKPGGFFAQIYVRDEAIGGTPPARYLMAQVTGGQRLLKPFEKRLQAKGVLPSGMQTVPGKGATLDAFGNIAGSQMNRILSQLDRSKVRPVATGEVDISDVLEEVYAEPPPRSTRAPVSSAPPVPPMVSDGRRMTGKPSCSTAAMASS